MRLFTVLATAFILHAPPPADGLQTWTDYSQTASSITGPIRLSAYELRADRHVFKLKLVATLDKLRSDDGDVSAQVFKVKTPANPLLLNRNRLCIGLVTWVVTWRVKSGLLGMAPFSGGKTPAALDGNDFCGTYYYTHAG